MQLEEDNMIRAPRAVQAAVLGLAIFALSGGIARGGTISFTGTFSADDNLQIFTFTLSGSSSIVARTFGYAGGTNAASTQIPAGGFDPWLSIFDAAGNLLASVDNGTCGQVATDSATGACLDSYISTTLVSGVYTLVLSESDNQPVGPTFADGFTRTGQGDFTASAFGCASGPFCDINAANRTSAWALDIGDVTSAVETGVPEPGLALISGLCLISLGLMRHLRAR